LIRCALVRYAASHQRCPTDAKVIAVYPGGVIIRDSDMSLTAGAVDHERTRDAELGSRQ